MKKPQQDPSFPRKRKEYVTIPEAAELLDCDPRTIQRKKKAGELSFVKDTSGGVHIALDDINKIIESRPPRPTKVDPHVPRMDHMQGQIDKLIQQVETLQQQFGLVLQAQATVSGEAGEEGDSAAQLPLPLNLSSLLTALARKRQHREPAPRLSPAQKRKLPDGSVFVTQFGREHAPQGVSIHDLKHGPGYAEHMTIIDRSDHATRNKKEWWLTPAQQHALITRFQQQGIAFTTCPHCPHEQEDHAA
jgi:DNA-binding transcriptional MerR regulator